MRTTTSVAVQYIEFSKVTNRFDYVYVNIIAVTTRISARLIDIGKDVARRVLIKYKNIWYYTFKVKANGTDEAATAEVQAASEEFGTSEGRESKREIKSEVR